MATHFPRHPDHWSEHLPPSLCCGPGSGQGRGLSDVCPMGVRWGGDLLASESCTGHASCSSISLAGASGVPRGLRSQPALSPPALPTAPSRHPQVLARDTRGLPSWVMEEVKARTRSSFCERYVLSESGGFGVISCLLFRVSLFLPCLLVVSEIRGHFVFPSFLITFSTTDN